MFVDIILPLALPNMLTYEVPKDMEHQMQIGSRVEVPLRNHTLTGLIGKLNTKPNSLHKSKKILAVLDDIPIVSITHIKFWQWIANYYVSTIGEVMAVALPGGLKLVSETRFVVNSKVDPYTLELTDDEFVIAEAVNIQGELRVMDIQDILDRKSIMPIIRSLYEKEVLLIKEELVEKYKPKKENFVKFPKKYIAHPEMVEELFEKVSRSDLQRRCLLAYIQIGKGKEWVRQSEIIKKAETNGSVVTAMVKKEILKERKRKSAE